MSYNKDQEKKKQERDAYNKELNMHLEALDRLAYNHFDFVLTHIKNQAILRKVDYKASDTELARELCTKSELYKLYRRLAQIEE